MLLMPLMPLVLKVAERPLKVAEGPQINLRPTEPHVVLTLLSIKKSHLYWPPCACDSTSS